MKQSRTTSFLKSVVSTAVGFAVAMVANALVLPLFGFTPSLSENFLITCIYTVISIGRGYVLERIFEAFGWRTRMSAFALAVLAERRRQIQAEGYDTHHDDQHDAQELACAAAAYAIIDDDERLACEVWPWQLSELKRKPGRRNNWKVAGSLLLAAGEHIDRNRKRAPATPTPANREAA